MHALILTPSRDRWRPSVWRPRRRAILWPPPLPSALRFNSGDSLAWFEPAANDPPSTNYAAFAFLANGDRVLEFTAAQQDVAIFIGKMPRNYAGGGLTVYATWAAKTATSGTIGWDVTFERQNDNNHTLGTDAWATAQTITAATTNGTAGKYTTTNVAITAGATGTDSVAAGDTFRLRVRRLSTDTATGFARLKSIEIKET